MMWFEFSGLSAGVDGGGQIGRRGGHRGEEEETVVGKINEKKKERNSMSLKFNCRLPSLKRWVSHGSVHMTGRCYHVQSEILTRRLSPALLTPPHLLLHPPPRAHFCML